MMNNVRFDRRDVAFTMASFRRGLRTGTTRVTRLPGIEFERVLRREVASQFGIKPQDFNTEYFSPATLKRFADFFAFPQHFDKETGSYHMPTQDEIAWAVQNFINRRKLPWNKFVGRVLGELVVGPLVEHKVRVFDEKNDPLEILDGDTMVVNSEEDDNNVVGLEIDTI